jgi:uncharacterized protein YegP (UPF0339 family)
MKFKLFRRLTLFGPRWYWRLVALNGRIVAQSEGYRNEADARSTIQSIRKNAAYAKVEPGE